MEKMIQKMMRAYPAFIAMGVMIVMTSFFIGLDNSANTSDYYALDKLTRETSQAWASVRASIESTVIWLPYFKFLGLAMILAGITMALGIIATKLQKLGAGLIGSIPGEVRMSLPPQPKTVMFMRAFMMMGMLIMIAGFVVALFTAGLAADVYSNPVAELDVAPTGSQLLEDIAQVHAAESWLEAFKFIGVAFLFLGIINGLSTIIWALRFQKQALPQIVEKLPTSVEPIPAVGD